MNLSGDAELLVAARRTLLDALEALAEQREALVLVGPGLCRFWTGAQVDLGEGTNKSANTPARTSLHRKPHDRDAAGGRPFGLEVGSPTQSEAQDRQWSARSPSPRW
jgi:hypothetical protein